MRMWMVRCFRGDMFYDFKDNNYVAIGWESIAKLVAEGMDRQMLISYFREKYPEASYRTAIAAASQAWRFVNEIQLEDWVLSYSPDQRIYLVGEIIGNAKFQENSENSAIQITRQVTWKSTDFSRDLLTEKTKFSLGSSLTIFELPKYAKEEIISRLKNPEPVNANTAKANEEIEENNIENIESLTIERIKDSVNCLTWSDMQELIAGILRAMGYKTQISPYGSDRGKDIVASPDGFGFEHPRIIVEVKHRQGAIGSQDIRSFLGGRQQDDRGLYVSTGGFSRDARYEAERASIALTLWTLDDVVRTLMEYYDNTDSETKRLVPLKRLYWLA